MTRNPSSKGHGCEAPSFMLGRYFTESPLISEICPGQEQDDIFGDRRINLLRRKQVGKRSLTCFVWPSSLLTDSRLIWTLHIRIQTYNLERNLVIKLCFWMRTVTLTAFKNILQGFPVLHILHILDKTLYYCNNIFILQCPNVLSLYCPSVLFDVSYMLSHHCSILLWYISTVESYYRTVLWQQL